MTLSQARLRIGAVVAALGLTALDLDKFLLPIVHALGLPDAVLNLPGPVKVAVIVCFAIYALAVTKKTSENNPDGTPATTEYDAGKEVL